MRFTIDSPSPKPNDKPPFLVVKFGRKIFLRVASSISGPLFAMVTKILFLLTRVCISIAGESVSLIASQAFFKMLTQICTSSVCEPTNRGKSAGLKRTLTRLKSLCSNASAWFIESLTLSPFLCRCLYDLAVSLISRCQRYVLKQCANRANHAPSASNESPLLAALTSAR